MMSGIHALSAASSALAAMSAARSHAAAAQHMQVYCGQRALQQHQAVRISHDDQTRRNITLNYAYVEHKPRGIVIGNNWSQEGAVYDARTHQYRIGEGSNMRVVAAEDWAPSRAAPYRYPSETPENWVAIEDQKDREFSRWIASLGLRRA